MKQCIRCMQWKDEEEFNWKNRLLGKRASVCRECQVIDRKEWYDAHADEVKQRSRINRIKAREEAERFVYEYLSDAVCADCGEYDFSVLTFDHVRGKKRKSISEMANNGFPIDTIRAEIEKCDVVCFNCHMRRENERRSGGRFRRFWPKMPWEE